MNYQYQYSHVRLTREFNAVKQYVKNHAHVNKCNPLYLHCAMIVAGTKNVIGHRSNIHHLHHS